MTTTKIIRQYEATSIVAILYNDFKSSVTNGISSKDDNGDSIPMSIRDASCDFNTLIFLSKIEVDENKRGEGFGHNALKEFCKEHEGTPIMLEAGFLYESDYNHYTKTGDWKLIDRLVSFYYQCGFLNVNDKYGFCEESVTMLNLNTSKGE